MLKQCGVLLGSDSADLGCPKCWMGVCVNPWDSGWPPLSGLTLWAPPLCFVGGPSEGTWKVRAVENFDYRER